MELITVVNEMPVFNPEVRTIKEFKRIIERDRGSKGDHDGRKKLTATKELAFVFFYCVYDSRFDEWQGEEKIKRIKEHVDLPIKWKVDQDMKEAIEKYKFMMETPSLRLYKKMLDGVKKIEDFIDEVDLTETTKSGGLVFSPDKLNNMIQKIPDMLKSLKVADEMIKKEIEDKGNKKEDDLSLVDREGTFAKVGGNY